MVYFTLTELTRSQTAAKYQILNSPSPRAISNLEALVNNVLDPLRSAWGKPITVTSGFRSQALNAKVGGTANSQHTKGEAADITAGSQDANRRLFGLILSLGLPFDQLIDEQSYRWLHVSYSQSVNRRQILHL